MSLAFIHNLLSQKLPNTSQGKQFRASARQTYLLGFSLLHNVEDVGNSDIDWNFLDGNEEDPWYKFDLKPCAKLSQCSWCHTHDDECPPVMRTNFAGNDQAVTCPSYQDTCCARVYVHHWHQVHSSSSYTWQLWHTDIQTQYRDKSENKTS